MRLTGGIGIEQVDLVQYREHRHACRQPPGNARIQFIVGRARILYMDYDAGFLNFGPGAGDAYALYRVVRVAQPRGRSEEHTSELQSLMRISYAVFCLKKKTSEHTT